MDVTAPSGGESVLADRRGGVLLLTLNRPERLNAWNDEMEMRYFDLLAEADADAQVKAVVVTGAGRGFCSGADMDDLSGVDSHTDLESVVNGRVRPRTFPLTLRKPLIAAINGAAAGIGLVEALFCDLRFATPEVKLTTSFARRGLIAEYGISWLMPRIVGLSAAMDLLLSGRVVRGEEAQRLRLIDRLAEPGDLVTEAVAYAQDLAENCSPWAMATIKAQIQADIDGSFAASTATADRRMLESLRGPDLSEGVNSYLERRPPRFGPLPPTI